MNFKTTAMLLESIQPYIENCDIKITAESTDWFKRSINSDLVIIDTENHVGFEVFENEIIVFYFTDHCHFEDYSADLSDGQHNYIERATSFLTELFRYKLRHIEYFKGEALYREKYILMNNDGREDEYIGDTWFGLSAFINPFGKKSMHSATWQFDILRGVFTTRQPKAPDPEAIEIIDVGDDCYIEIFCKRDIYTYSVMEIDYDDYLGMYYWAPAVNICATGMYDTRKKAIDAAREALRCRQGEV